MSGTGEKHSTRVHIMMSPSELRAVDEWRRQQPDLPSRAEAIRRLIQLGIAAKAPKSTR
jgi:metal-responsive CopG/Arc/MetJ family transcriptional regulator